MIAYYWMENRPHLLQKFFNLCGLTGFVLSLKTEVISSKPTVSEIVSLLYTFSFTYSLAILTAITFIVIEIFYEIFIKPKIFKDDNSNGLHK